MKGYDIILAGGGAAGLSLACHLIQSPLYRQKILLVEQNARGQNDHPWCFWTNQPILFDEIVSHSWSQLQIFDEGFAKTLDLQSYRYKMIDSNDFYRFASHMLSTAPQIEFVQGKVEHIEDGEQVASVLIDGQRYTGTWIFDSIFDQAGNLPTHRHYHLLKQQFKGKEITTPEPIFNPEIATFLDFRAPQKQGAHFFYVLPFSQNHALVESVFYTPTPIDWKICDQVLDLYFEQVLKLPSYVTKREEQGITRLTDQPFPRRTGKHVMTIGMKGGRVKPSTGYAFWRIQQDSSAIVYSLIEAGHPFHVPISPRRYRFFDSVLLEIVTSHKEMMAQIFTELFRRNSVERIFRFLDEIASPWENGLMVPSLPTELLRQALCQISTLRVV